MHYSCQYVKFELSKVLNIEVEDGFPAVIKTTTLKRNPIGETLIHNVLRDAAPHGIKDVQLDRHIGNINDYIIII